MPSEEVHATVHVTIENQIAMGDEAPVRRAVERLRGEGLDRHEAVHAVGWVFAEQLFKTLNDPRAHAFPLEEYNAAIERLTAESWRRDLGDEDNEGSASRAPLLREARQAGRGDPRRDSPSPHAAQRGLEQALQSANGRGAIRHIS
jgi:hypothetical protein